MLRDLRAATGKVNLFGTARSLFQNSISRFFPFVPFLSTQVFLTSDYPATLENQTRRNQQLVKRRKPSPFQVRPRSLKSSNMLVLGKHAATTLEARTSDLFARIQRIEAEQSALRAQMEAERQLRFLTTEIVGAAQAAPTIGKAVEVFAEAMRAPLPRGRAGGLARASTAWRYFDGTFMPESEKEEAHREEYERYAAGGRTRAAKGLRFANGRFAPAHREIA